MDEETPTTHDVARHFFEVIPPLWQSMSSIIRYSGDETGQVTFPQLRAMLILRQRAASLNDLSTIHEVSPATMSRMVSTLVERGWVQREVDAEDRRQVRLTLTEKGESSMNVIGTRGINYMAEMFNELSNEELKDLERSLTALGRIVKSRRNQVSV